MTDLEKLINTLIVQTEAGVLDWTVKNTSSVPFATTLSNGVRIVVDNDDAVTVDGLDVGTYTRLRSAIAKYLSARRAKVWGATISRALAGLE